MPGARVLPHDQPRSPSLDAGAARLVHKSHEGSRAMLCQVFQPASPPNRNAMGRAFSLVRRGICELCARLLSIHRVESGSCRHGQVCSRLPLVKPCGELGCCRGSRDFVTPRIPGAGSQPTSETRDIPAALRRCHGRLNRDRNPRCNPRQPSTRQRVLQGQTSGEWTKGGAWTAWAAGHHG